MYKIGVLGDRESVLGFKALGLDAFSVNSPEKAKKLLHQMAKDDYAIIYIIERLAVQMVEDIDMYKDSRLPAIILIPGKFGGLGRGMDSLKKSVERAVGADILFGGDK